MGKILLWVLVILAVLVAMRLVASRSANRSSNPDPGRNGNAGPTAGSDQAAASQRASQAHAQAKRAGERAGNFWSKAKNTARPIAGGIPDPTLGAIEPMVRCAHCGIHLPRSEALLKDGETWCSNAHASLGVRQG